MTMFQATGAPGEAGRRPRVLYVTAWLPTPASSTTGIFVERDIRALARIADVHVIHLVAPHLAQGAAQREIWKQAGRKITIERVPTTPTNPLSLLRAGRSIRRRFAHADLLHTATPASLLALGAIRVPIPWVHTDHWSGYADVQIPRQHGDESAGQAQMAGDAGDRHAGVSIVNGGAPPAPGAGKRITLGALGYVMRRVDVLIGVSTTLSAQLAQLSGREAITVPNIVDMALCEARPHVNPWAAQRPLRIICVANAVAGKRPLLAVDVCAELIRRGRTVELLWVGEGPLLGSLREHAHASGVPLHAPGALPPERVRDSLAVSDLFLLPTVWESFCLAAAEALSAGRPVVMGDQGGQRAFVHAPSGALVSGDEPMAYADAIEAVLHATAGLSAAEIARNVRQSYSEEAFVGRYRKIYSSVLSKG